MRIGKDGTRVMKEKAEAQAVKAVELEPCKEPLELTAEGLGGLFRQAKLRRVSSPGQPEYQAWVDGLDKVRQCVLSAYELGYLHGTFDGREGRPVKRIV